MLVLVFALVFAIILIGCGEKEPEVKEPDPIAPTAVTIDATIYSGSENEKYVVKGEKMYIEAEFEGPEGYDEGLDWSIEGNAATLEVEDHVAVITGVTGGNAVVTAKSKIDATVQGQYTVEVVDSEDFNQIIVDAKDKVASELPTYVTEDFALPQPDNPNVKVNYMSQLKKPWADGMFKFSDAYVASKGDITYVFYGTFVFHGIKKEFEFSVKCVGDALNNDFYALSAAKAKVEPIFENKNISVDFKDIIDNANGTYTIALPESITVEGFAQPVKIEWKAEEGCLSIKDNNKLIYSKPLVDTPCQINAIYKTANNNDISKFYLTAVGWTPDEVWKYIKENCWPKDCYNSTTDTFASNKAGISVPITDTSTSKKFKLLSIDYEVLEESADILSYTAPTSSSATKGTFKKLGTGEAKVKVTLTYNKIVRKVMVDEVDENGVLVRDAEGNVQQVQVEQIVSDWTKEFEIVITLS